MTKDPKIPSGMIGHAGEHYVIYELHRRGHLAALAPEGSPTSDVLVMTPDGQSAACALQVKTRTGSSKWRGWMFSKKHETIISDGLAYVLVDLNPSPPHLFIVPSDVVADAVARSHKAWLAGKPKKGTTRKDTSMRAVHWEFPFDLAGYPPGWLEEWRDRWDLVEQRLQ